MDIGLPNKTAMRLGATMQKLRLLLDTSLVHLLKDETKCKDYRSPINLIGLPNKIAL